MNKKITIKSKLHFISAVFMLMSVCAVAQPPAPAGYYWVKDNNLSDEFNGARTNNSINTSKWDYSTWNYSLESSVTTMKASQVKEWGGYLRIKAQLDGYTANQIDYTKKVQPYKWMKSGRIQSKANFTYPMYSEARIKCSSISAYNTFWFNYGDSQNRDEIDVIENNAAPTQNKPELPYTMMSSIWTATNGVEKTVHKYYSTKDIPLGKPGKDKKFDQEEFTYGVYWIDRNTVKYYLNGREVLNATPPGRQFWDKSQLKMIFDHWSNWWDGYPTPASLQDNNKNTMLVNWVRTYKLVSTKSATIDPEEVIADETEEFNIFPNPAKDEITISGLEDEFTRIFIYDIAGTLKLSANASQNNNSINISSLTPGCYIIKSRSESGKNYKIIKFIKQ